MKEELKTKYVPPSFSARLKDNWHQYTQVTNLQKSMSRNSMNSLLEAVPFIEKVKLKFFPDLEPVLGMIYEVNC